MNPTRIVPLFALIAATSLAGCTQAVDDDLMATADDELGVTTASRFTVSEWDSAVTPCSDYRQVTVDLVAGRLDGSRCEYGQSVSVTRWLHASELTALKSALAKVKTVAKPSTCTSPDLTRTLSVLRGSKEASYVDVAHACEAKGKSVTEASLSALLTIAKATADKGPRKVLPGGTTNGVPSGRVGGTCVDRTSKPAYTSFGGIAFTYGELGRPNSKLRWDGSSIGGGRAGDVLNEYLRNAQTIGLDGVTRDATVGTQWSPVGREDVFVTGKLEDDKLSVTMGTKSGRFSCSFEAAVD